MNELISLANLFNKKIFRIPDYQRGYAWKTQQLDDFWDDLYNLNGGRIHYTGMLSLKKLKPKEYETWLEEKWIIQQNSYEAYHVVDGQQRLTTFIILLNSIISLAESLGEEYINDDRIEIIKEQYIVQYNKGKISKAYKFGYETDNPSFKFLRFKILGEDSGGTIQETFYTLNLQNAKETFDKKLREVYEQKGYEAIEGLFSKLTNKLHFNIHYINDDFDVFVAFETMNNRGKKLSNLEILKNRLIYLTTIYPDDVLPQEDREQMRRDINETWSEVYYQLGRNKNNPLDDDEYLKNHWTLYFKYSRTTGDDYIQYLLNKQFTPKAIYGEHIHFDMSELNDEENDLSELDSINLEDDILYPMEIQDYVKSLKQVAQYWYYSFNPQDADIFSEEEKKWINRLNRIGIAYFRTLVVSSFINKKVTEIERIKLFTIIERFIFLCFRMARYQSNYLSNIAYTNARELYKGTKSISEITKFFQKQTDDNMKDAINSFANNMNRNFNNYDGFYTWNDLKYVLFEYEAELAKDHAIKRLDDWTYFTKTPKDKVSVEHIYPQKPSKLYWKNQFRKYSNDRERHYLTNSLGNLLALSLSVNATLQNDDFISKKKNRYGYEKGSYSEGEVALNDDWTPQHILDRGLHLLSFIEKRWNIEFPNEDFKISLLGLSFLKEERADIPEIQEIDYSSRDSYFRGEKGEIKVSEYLFNKEESLVEYYFDLFKNLKIRIPSLYETATKNYIALKCSESARNIAEIHIQNSKKCVCIITKTPKDDNIRIGERLPDNFLWSLDYRIYLKENDNFEQASDIIFEACESCTNFNLSEEEIEDTLKHARNIRTANICSLVREYDSKGNLKALCSNNKYIRFTTPTIREVVGLIGDGTWSGMNDLIVYEINNYFDKATLTLIVGPAEEKNKRKWIDFAKSNSMFKVQKGKKWTPIYRASLFQNDDSQVLDKLKNFIENVIPKIDELFNAKNCTS